MDDNYRDHDPKPHKNLPRLDRAEYQGLAYVHWVFNIRDRKTGWLTPEFLLRFQLIAAHTFLRYKITSPCVCLMPDHIHLLLIGYSAEQSDQIVAIEFLRKHLKPFLEPNGFEFQRPAYDHVLRAKERDRDSFQNHAAYIRNNPFRAGLVEKEGDPWPYECAIAPGYPDLDMRSPDFWDLFWKIYYGKLLETPNPKT